MRAMSPSPSSVLDVAERDDVLAEQRVLHLRQRGAKLLDVDAMVLSETLIFERVLRASQRSRLTSDGRAYALLDRQVVAVVLVAARPSAARAAPRVMPAFSSPAHLSGLLVMSATDAHAEVAQDRRGEVVAAQVGGEAELLVGLDGVGAFGLQRVGADLVAEADAAPLLPQIDDDAAARRGDGGERAVELLAAVALERAQRLAGPALRMHAREQRRRRHAAASSGPATIATCSRSSGASPARDRRPP